MLNREKPAMHELRGHYFVSYDFGNGGGKYRNRYDVMRPAHCRRLKGHQLAVLFDRSLLRLPLTLSSFVTAALLGLWHHEKLRARNAPAPHECHEEKDRETRA